MAVRTTDVRVTSSSVGVVYSIHCYSFGLLVCNGSRPQGQVVLSCLSEGLVDPSSTSDHTDDSTAVGVEFLQYTRRQGKDNDLSPADDKC